MEHIIRQKIQSEGGNGAGPSSGSTPAPMVERAFRLLDILSTSEDGLTLSELARTLEMSKGSIHGLLKTLESSGVIELSEERRYILGPRLYDLAQTYIRRSGLRRFALPAMHRLATSTSETIFLGRLEPEGVRIIECIKDESDHSSLHITAPRGMRVPLLAGALGRTVLATWPQEKRHSYLQEHSLPHFTSSSLTDVPAYLDTVAETARTGIGLDHGEYLEGVNAVAAPIYGPDQGVVALLWIVGFASRFDDTTMSRAVEQLHNEADAISQALGGKLLV